MGVFKKLTPYELSNLKTRPRQLNTFWRSYFEKVTIEFNKYFFTLYKNFPNIRFINRQVVKVQDFLDEVEGSLCLYQVLPHGSIGLVYFPNELTKSLINISLGGQTKNNKNNEIGKFGENFIQSVMEKVITIMSEFFEDQGRKVDLVIVDPKVSELILHGININEHISIQQFSFNIEDETYFFEIVLSNSLLEGFSIL